MSSSNWGCKATFWEEVADIIYQKHQANFTGRECNNKFLALTRAYYTTCAFRNGTGCKRSLIGENFYDEFSFEFWKKPVHPGSPETSPVGSSCVTTPVVTLKSRGTSGITSSSSLSNTIKVVPKPVSNRSGYDMKYISAYTGNYCYGTDINKISKIEKQYDGLLVVKPGQFLVEWAMSVRIQLQELLTNQKFRCVTYALEDQLYQLANRLSYQELAKKQLQQELAKR
ncbi:hypothetical protein C1645_822261 [Glomus cerebriforme]|uniref:Myb/SANT-like domain-containing protein n=1 Tax=Glomus cerebriforme TaxID=658196 RepID=A0A397T1S6_9GLOM|nr:hypothetical protein C1645_822261 [Glomus cerebriforme]